MEHGPISFPDWKQAFARAGFEPSRRSCFVREARRWFYREGRRKEAAPDATDERESGVSDSDHRGARGPKASGLGATRSTSQPASPIRTVPELMGHASVETTQIYLRVMKKPGVGVCSPFDALRAGPPDQSAAKKFVTY